MHGNVNNVTINAYATNRQHSIPFGYTRENKTFILKFR